MYRKVWYPNFKMMVALKDILWYYSSSSVRATIAWGELSRYIHNRRSLCFPHLMIKNYFAFLSLKSDHLNSVHTSCMNAVLRIPAIKGNWMISERWMLKQDFFLFPPKENISSIGEKDQIQKKTLWFWRRWEVLKLHLSVEKGCWSRTGKERSWFPRG